MTGSGFLLLVRQHRLVGGPAVLCCIIAYAIFPIPLIPIFCGETS